MYYLQNLCLLCLKSNVTLKNINHVDSDNVSILDKLEYTTVLFINDFHGTTLYICDECHINLNNTYAFKKLSTRNINYFKAYTHQLRTISKTVKYLSVALDKNSVYINDEDVNENRTQHIQIERDIPVFESKEDNNENLERFPRQISNTNIKVVDNKLVNEISTENNAKEKQFKCTICRKVFQLRHHLREHARTYIGQKSFNCFLCSKAFHRKVNLINHARTHTGGKPFKCHLCSKAFKVKHHLKEHIRIHTGEKPFKCHLCSKAFVQKGDLSKHIRTHTGEKPFKCHLCSKAFIQKHHLNNHVRTHTGEKPYKCNICSKAFSLKQNLNTHIRTHTGKKPFKCHLCAKAFSRKEHLNNHIRTHTGEKSFKCHLCLKGFVQRRILIKHIKTHGATTLPNDNTDILESEVQNNIKVEDENETLLKQVEEDISIFKREDIDTDSDLFEKEISNAEVKREV